MKLERFNNKKRQRMMVVIFIIGIILFIGGISFYKTYALYETKKEYNVIKGTVPDFGYDVKLAITVDDKKQEKMPSSPKGDNGLYYEVKVSCGSSKTSGLWDYNAWRLNLDYIESNSKCNLEFTSSMSKEQYDEYIKSGVSLRRNTYRGKDITDLWESGDLYKQIEDGTFADIYVGDYIKGNNGITWLIADIDNYSMNATNNYHHVTVIPDGCIQTAVMNSTITTTGGYINSDLYKNILPNILKNYVEPTFENHIIAYNNNLSNSADSNGVVNGNENINIKIDLMNEINVYGFSIATNVFDIGLDSNQYSIFRLNPQTINKTMSGIHYYYWLKSITSAKAFSVVHVSGQYGELDTNAQGVGVRPKIIIY